jgi:hypothetical protein
MIYLFFRITAFALVATVAVVVVAIWLMAQLFYMGAMLLTRAVSR